MRVQWNSNAVEQLRKRLWDAREGLEMCERQARGVRLCLEDANPDGENRTLRASLARFEECCARLRLLTERVDAYDSALLRADDTFEQAEARAVRYAEAIDVVSYAKTPVSRSNGFRWEPASVAYMASLRESAPPMPDWLDALLN